MYDKLFNTLDLSPNEGKIYFSLLEHGQSGISAIAIYAKIHRRNAYDAIHRLVDKGLVSEVWSPSENLYEAVDPEKLRELLAEQQSQLEDALPELNKKYHATHSEQSSYIFKGHEGMKNVWREMIQAKSTIYTLGGKGQWFDERLKSANSAFLKEARKQGLKFKILFDPQAISKFPELKEYYKGTGQHRILPKEYDTGSTIHIFEDYIVTYAGASYGKLDTDCTFFIIQSKAIADSYRKWFDYMWSLSKA